MALKNVFRSTVLGLRTWSVFAGARQGTIVIPAFKQPQCSFYANLTVTGICKRKYKFSIDSKTNRLLQHYVLYVHIHRHETAITIMILMGHLNTYPVLF